MDSELYKRALRAVMALFEDRSVSQEETKVALKALIDEIELLVETLED